MLPSLEALTRSRVTLVSTRVARYAVAVATMLAAWLVSFSARAEAPLCDTRGATTFAPAPQLQEMPVSIDLGLEKDECDPLKLLRMVSKDRPGRSWDAPVADPVAVTHPAPRFAPGSAPAHYAEPSMLPPCTGVHSSIERPPRR